MLLHGQSIVVHGWKNVSPIVFFFHFLSYTLLKNGIVEKHAKLINMLDFVEFHSDLRNMSTEE